MMQIKRLNSSSADFNEALDKLLAFEDAQDESIHATVSAILADVKKRGDAALLEYTRRFDRTGAAAVAELELEKSRLHEALHTLPADRRDALEQAAGRIRAYHEKQVSRSWSYTDPDGTLLGQKDHSARPRRPIRPWRQGVLPLVGADECHPCQSCRRGRAHYGRARSRRRYQ